jgi:hypothetical protein
MRVIQIEIRLDVKAQSSQLNMIEMHISKECIMFEINTFQGSSTVATWKITLLHTTKIWQHIKLTSL